MSRTPRFATVCVLTAAFVLASSSLPATADDAPSRQANPRRAATRSRLGVQAIGLFGLGARPDAGSLDAVGLPAESVEVGGAVQVTSLWRSLFVQVGVSRTRRAGERAFIDSRGTVFPLGIRLRVEMTSVDAGVGWRFERFDRTGRPGRLVPYAGGGAGIVRYEESSPFAQPGEDVAATRASYHVFSGVEVGLARWLGIAGDVRYRLAPGILGQAGVSRVFEAERLAGASVSLRVLVGPRGLASRRARPAYPPPAPRRRRLPAGADPPAQGGGIRSAPDAAGTRTRRPARIAIINIDTAVYVTPTEAQAPLSVLKAGTRVAVQAEAGDWLLVEFDDPRWGPRTGYVRKEHCDW